MKLNFRTRSPEETIRLGEKIGGRAAAGTVIALTGELGSGKTAFTQGLARGMGIKEAYVASPSYTLVNHYPGKGLALYHVDLYRLADRQEAEDLGLEEVLHRQGVVAIEWAEKFGDHFWREDVEVRLSVTGETDREISLISRGPAGDNILSVLLTENNAGEGFSLPKSTKNREET
jgi:tRNA threonylcarbamoyladenosine biosynthesis protein TsaE